MERKEITSIEIKNKVQRLMDLIPKDSRVAFYPSAGTHPERYDFSNLPLDYIICSDYHCEEWAEEKIITIQAENNLCLRIIFEADIKLDAVFAVQDGFFEGGNHEIVNSIGFLGRLLPILKDQFVFVNSPNNKNYHDIEKGPIERTDEDVSIYFNAFYSGYGHNIKDYIIYKYKRVDYPKKTIQLSNGKTIALMRKSIWEDQKILDGIYKGLNTTFDSKTGLSLHYYWPISLLPKKLFDIFDLTQKGSILPLLEHASKYKFDTIGMVPFAAGKERNDYFKNRLIPVYEKMVHDFESWNEEYPKQINLYHFDKYDFSDLYSRCE